MKEKRNKQADGAEAAATLSEGPDSLGAEDGVETPADPAIDAPAPVQGQETAGFAHYGAAVSVGGGCGVTHDVIDGFVACAVCADALSE